MTKDWPSRANELSAQAYRDGTPTAWFEQLYREGLEGSTTLAWEHDEPHPLLAEWVASSGMPRGPAGDRTAVVVGCGLGADAEFLAGLGFVTTGFDLSPAAIELARQRHTASAVDYRVADLTEPPADWAGAFDLVVEIYTLQAVPDPPRAAMLAGVRSLVAPGGTLVAIQFRTDDGAASLDGPPFALDRSTMEALAEDDLRLVSLEARDGPLWLGEYRRDSARC